MSQAEIINISDLKYLAEQFALPLFVRDNTIVVAGNIDTLIFTCRENNTCQLQQLSQTT